MTQREHEVLSEADPHALLFGDDDEDFDEPNDIHARLQSRSERRRAERAHQSRHRRNGRLMVLLTAVLVAAVAIFVVPKLIDHFEVKDYSGAGTSAVRITIPTGASASDIGDVLVKAGVVESDKAFTNAASANAKSTSIQPGTYVLKKRMSAKNALTLLLDPSARSAQSDVVVFEGATTLDVQAKLVASLGSGQKAAVAKAINDTATLGLPLGYSGPKGAPTSAEGFLYPATYNVDPGDSPTVAVQNMVARFVEQDRATGFAGDAKKLKITPYQALTIASIAQSEAKFAADMPKVVRVILNRIRIGKPLQVDATSVYAAKLKGLNPAKVEYDKIVSPYNTYTNAGLPPTPISNPGAEAMSAAVHPATGDWTYYVNSDKNGDLFFTNSATAFTAAQQKCHDQGWGCAAP